jgi:hypothetical protein
MQGAPIEEEGKDMRVKRFNKEQFKQACQVIGCKPQNAISISDLFFDELNKIINGLN